jgi:hypothetical protein
MEGGEGVRRIEVARESKAKDKCIERETKGSIRVRRGAKDMDSQGHA